MALAVPLTTYGGKQADSQRRCYAPFIRLRQLWLGVRTHVIFSLHTDLRTTYVGIHTHAGMMCRTSTGSEGADDSRCDNR